ncbi:hypothetical protein ACR9PT_13825 [Piscirickettsia salmonis]|uniref:hypothetical protein n=1 Tax=Piscirickettsia salmonis TaxID=1238 RepID=UPI003EB87C34
MPVTSILCKKNELESKIKELLSESLKENKKHDQDHNMLYRPLRSFYSSLYLRSLQFPNYLKYYKHNFLEKDKCKSNINSLLKELEKLLIETSNITFTDYKQINNNLIFSFNLTINNLKKELSLIYNVTKKNKEKIYKIKLDIYDLLADLKQDFYLFITGKKIYLLEKELMFQSKTISNLMLKSSENESNNQNIKEELSFKEDFDIIEEPHNPSESSSLSDDDFDIIEEPHNPSESSSLSDDDFDIIEEPHNPSESSSFSDNDFDIIEEPHNPSESSSLSDDDFDIIEEPHNPSESSSLLYEKGSCLFNCQLKFDQLGVYKALLQKI